MTNGSNDWGVAYSKILWLENLLLAHSNISSAERERDIYFQVQRKVQKDTLGVLALDEYVAGMAIVLKALKEFGAPIIIHIGGGWCSYTREAKEYCIENKIGLYVTNEMSGALWRNDFWGYHKRDEDGNPEYYFGNS